MNKIAAIQARLKGYGIIPLRGGDVTSPDYKRPLVNWERYQHELATVAEIQEWEAGAYAIPTGPISGIFVLDVDTKEDIKWPGEMPNTYRVATRRGYHYYFKWSDALLSKVTTKAFIQEHVDVRGEGGYVVAWDLENLPHSSQLCDVPVWLVNALPDKARAAAPTAKEESWMINELRAITPGEGVTGRTPTFVRIINSLKRKGLRPADVEAFLVSWAEQYSYGLDRLHRLVEDQFKRYPAPVDKTAGVQGQDIEAFLTDTETVEWLVPGLIAKKSIAFIAGLPETMKTWLTIDLAIELARPEGGKWVGKFPVNHAKVLFVDQERFKGETQRRFRAVLSGKGLSPATVKGNLFMKCGTTTRIDLQHSFDAFKKELADLQPDLVIVDSFATFHTREENNRKEIQEVLERIKELRNEFGCTFVFIDHENKGVFHDKENDEEEPSAMRMVGSVAKPAAAETIFTVRRNSSDSSFVYHTKSTLSGTQAPFLVSVHDKNPERTSIIVEGR